MDLNTVKDLIARKETLSTEEHAQLVTAVVEYGELVSFHSDKTGKNVIYKQFMGCKVFMNLV